MAEGTIEDKLDPAARARAAARPFVGDIPDRIARRDENEPGGSIEADRDNARSDDARTIDPTQIGIDAKRRGPGGRKWTEARKAAARARHAAAREAKDQVADQSQDGVERARVEIDPTVVGQVSQAIFGLHQMMAIAMQAPELALSDTESTSLSKAITNVGRYYIRIKLDTKFGAWMALAITSGMIYIPRVMAINMRKSIAPAGGPQPSPPPTVDDVMFDGGAVPSDLPSRIVM